VLVICYASLYPFEDWRNQDIAPWSFVGAPWPKYQTLFDMGSNFLGYMPLGFWLSLAMLRSAKPHWAALLLGFWGALGLSFLMECSQSYLPQRVPSQVDWMLNSLGGLTGAVLSAWLERRGWLYRWVQFRHRWLLPHASGSLVLMVLWPLALLFPTPVFLGLGNVTEKLLAVLQEWWPQATLSVQLLQTLFSFAPLPPWVEMLSIAGSLSVAALLGMAVVREAWQRLSWVSLVVALALLSNTLSAAVTYGPEHTFFWLTPLTAAGLAVGWLSALLMVRLPAVVLMRTMLLIQAAVLCVVNLVPSSTYFAQTVQTWEQGKFIRFHGLTDWLSWGWPFALMVWGVMHLLSNPTHVEAT
jgi:VanZ family protein